MKLTSRPRDNGVLKIAEIASVIIGRQFGRVMSECDDDAYAKKQLSSKYALGYMFGIIDATLQECDIDRSSQQALDIMFAVYKQLFDEDGVQIMEAALSLQEDFIFDSARNLGGERAFTFLSTNIEVEPPESLFLLFRPEN